MAFSIETIQDDKRFVDSPYECLDQLFNGCQNDTLVIPRYPDEDPFAAPDCYDCYEMHWSEEECESIKKAFTALYSELKTIAADGYNEEKVLAAVREADDDPDHFVNVYSKRVCRLMDWNAPDFIVSHEAVCLIVSMAANKYATGYHRENNNEPADKVTRDGDA